MKRYYNYIRYDRGIKPVGKFSVEKEEKKVSQEVINIITLKSIYDNIINTERQLEGTQTNDIYAISSQEPPFYPSLSEEEKSIVWAWVKAKEAALDTLYDDETYQFTMKVAGHVNMSEFGIDKLITSAHQQRSTMSQFGAMPPSYLDESRMTREREDLFSRMIQLKQAIEKSKYEDIKREQKLLNSERPKRPKHELRSFEENEEYQKIFTMRYGAKSNEVPNIYAELADFDTMPLSENTRMLMYNFETIEKALGGLTLEHSRKRMLLATNWMQRPEVLKHGDLSPLFISALGAALSRMRHRCQNLQQVGDYSQLIESPDLDVVDSFAELTALQIMRIRFFSPTRVFLDKMGERISSRENRLLYLMNKFSYDGKHVRSNLGSSTDWTMQALYAF